jgi:DNA-binding NtrC family response regulator
VLKNLKAMKNSLKIFIVEDDTFYGSLLKNEIVKNRLGNVEHFSTGESFLENLFKMPDIVLLDYHLGTMNGVNILKKIKSINPNIHVILLSAQEQMKIAITSLKYGAYDYIEKNDIAFTRIKGLIRSISNFNEIMEEQKHIKLIKTVFTLLIVSLFFVSIYMHL